MKTKKISHHLVLLMVVLALLSCSTYEKEEIIIEPGTGIHHDDFEYSVVDYTLYKTIAGKEDLYTTDGNLYIVTFKVVNNAIRVNHDWDNSTAYLVDEYGNEYENKIDLQKKLEETEPFGFKESYVTPFQSQSTTRMIFELPASVKIPYLKVRGETRMGDFLDGNQFERTKIKLF